MSWQQWDGCRRSHVDPKLLLKQLQALQQDALTRQKSQVFSAEEQKELEAAVEAAARKPSVPAAPGAAALPGASVGAVDAESKCHAAAPAAKTQQFAVPQVPVKAAQPDAEYSRRAAANLIQRLRKNPGRLANLPSLHQMVFEEESKNELISMLCENGGQLEQVNMHLQQMEERGRVFSAKKKAVRLTKKQMQDTYGEDADKVMKHKESIGMVEDDENVPNGLVYLVAQREDEEDNFKRTGGVGNCLFGKFS